MKTLRNVKIGDKFAFSNEPGIFKKVSHNKKRCVFGPNEQFNVESEIDPEAGVFVIPREPVRKPKLPPDNTIAVFTDSEVPDSVPTGAIPIGTGEIPVVIMDSEEKPIQTINVLISRASIIIGADAIRVKGKDGKVVAYSIMDSGYDDTTDSVFLEVTKA